VLTINRDPTREVRTAERQFLEAVAELDLSARFGAIPHQSPLGKGERNGCTNSCSYDNSAIALSNFSHEGNNRVLIALFCFSGFHAAGLGAVVSAEQCVSAAALSGAYKYGIIQISAWTVLHEVESVKHQDER
jgi:hypothetical protein